MCRVLTDMCLTDMCTLSLQVTSLTNVAQVCQYVFSVASVIGLFGLHIRSLLLRFYVSFCFVE